MIEGGRAGEGSFLAGVCVCVCARAGFTSHSEFAAFPVLAPAPGLDPSTFPAGVLVGVNGGPPLPLPRPPAGECGPPPRWFFSLSHSRPWIFSNFRCAFCSRERFMPSWMRRSLTCFWRKTSCEALNACSSASTAFYDIDRVLWSADEHEGK